MTYNLIGFKNYELTILQQLPERNKQGKVQWLARCSCGRNKILTTYEVQNSKTCHNCQWHIDHKESYISWMAMKQRCDDSSRKDYKYYGASGITYQKSWGIFVRFYQDMGDPPTDITTGERMSLERKNTLGNYEKDNCTWATRSEQQLNKSDKYIKGVDDKDLANSHPE